MAMEVCFHVICKMTMKYIPVAQSSLNFIMVEIKTLKNLFSINGCEIPAFRAEKRGNIHCLTTTLYGRLMVSSDCRWGGVKISWIVNSGSSGSFREDQFRCLVVPTLGWLLQGNLVLRARCLWKLKCRSLHVNFQTEYFGFLKEGCGFEFPLLTHSQKQNRSLVA